MIFDGTKIILYLKSKSLEVYWKDKSESENLDFTECVGNLEVTDKAKLESSLKEFIERIGIKNHSSLLILSKPVLFEKTVVLNNPEGETEVQNYLKEIPFPQEQLIKKEVKRGNVSFLVATPKAFLQDLKTTLENAGLKIELVTAVSLIEGVGDRDILSPAEVTYILDRVSSLKEIDFSTEDSKPEIAVSQATLAANKVSKLPLLILALLLIVGGFLSSGMILGLIKNPFVEEEIQPLKTSELKEEEATSSKSIIEVSEATSSALEEDSVNREELKVKIMNGTGTPGEAGKVKERIIKLGFKEVEVGNDKSYSSLSAEIAYSSRVSAEVKEEVEKELKQIFESLTETELVKEDFDIFITTGKQSSR